jgi:hypothetical protein
MGDKYNIKAYYSFDEMMNDADFDILHICTPHIFSNMFFFGIVSFMHTLPHYHIFY